MYLGGIQVYSTAMQAIAAAAADTTLTFNTVYFDDLGVWNSAAPTQIVVPAGVTHVRVYWHSHWAIQTTVGALTGNCRTRAFKNGVLTAPVLGNTGTNYLNAANPPTNAVSASTLSQLIPATPGDIWTLVCDQGTNASLVIFGLSFGMEFYS